MRFLFSASKPPVRTCYTNHPDRSNHDIACYQLPKGPPALNGDAIGSQTEPAQLSDQSNAARQVCDQECAMWCKNGNEPLLRPKLSKNAVSQPGSVPQDELLHKLVIEGIKPNRHGKETLYYYYIGCDERWANNALSRALPHAVQCTLLSRDWPDDFKAVKVQLGKKSIDSVTCGNGELPAVCDGKNVKLKILHMNEFPSWACNKLHWQNHSVQCPAPVCHWFTSALSHCVLLLSIHTSWHWILYRFLQSTVCFRFKDHSFWWSLQ